MKVKFRGREQQVQTVAFDEGSNEVVLVEQRLLPHQFEFVRCEDYRSTAKAIRDMVVRGAGAIGATAAFGLVQGLRSFRGNQMDRFKMHLAKVFKTLRDARRTAVDPVNAMVGVIARLPLEGGVRECQRMALEAAFDFANEDVAHCRSIGAEGEHLIRDGSRILTHCNAGWLAFVDFGTATAPMYAAHENGVRFHVYCDETRPRCQGSSLTAWELANAGISHQVIPDNAAGYLMWKREIDLVIVGSDRVLGRTGEVANKIGTYTKAVLAKRHGIPFYVAIPLSTIDWKMASGAEIPIEERCDSEVLCAWGLDESGVRRKIRIANPTSTGRNPGFDVTSADLITGIITPIGIFKPGDLWRRRKELGYASNLTPIKFVETLRA